MRAFFASFAQAGGSRGPATELPTKLPFPDAVHAALGGRAAGLAVLEVFAGDASGGASGVRHEHSAQHAFVCGGAFAPNYRPRLTAAERPLVHWLDQFLEAAEVQAGCERATFHETHELLDLLRRARAAYAGLVREGWFAVRAGHPRVHIEPRDLLFKCLPLCTAPGVVRYAPHCTPRATDVLVLELVWVAVCERARLPHATTSVLVRDC
jgi:hypothetical protein